MLAIEAIDLKKSFGDFEAVKGISFQVQPGETYGLLGPNGAGKTTTMRLLAGLSPMSSGCLRVLGLDVQTEGRKIRKSLGVVTQADGLDAGINVRQNLMVFAELMGFKPKQARQRADEILEFFLLADKAEADVNDLSGGMKRRLAIARALLAKPRVIILDEPSTGLDPDSRMRVWEELAALKREGVTLLMSTHYMDEAETLCDRIAMMHGGTILDEGTPAQLVAAHAGEAAVDVRPTTASRAEVRDALTAAGIGFREMGAVFRVRQQDQPQQVVADLGVTISDRTPNLEDVFLNVAGRGLTDD